MLALRLRIPPVALSIAIAILAVALLATLSWAWLPRWSPQFVIRHSPWVEPALRAEASGEVSVSDGLSDTFTRRLNAWGSEAFSGLSSCLRSDNSRLRQVAMQAIVELAVHEQPGPATLDAVEGAAKDSDGEVRLKALTLLANHANASRAATFCAAAKSERADARRIAVQALGRLQDSSFIPNLVDALGDRDERVALAAIDALTLQKEATVVEPIAQLMASSNAARSAAATKAILVMSQTGLSKEQRAAAAAAMTKKLDRGGADDVPMVAALGDDAVPVLERALESSNRQTRILAAATLVADKHEATSPLAEVAVEALEKPKNPGDDALFNTKALIDWLIVNIDQAEPELLKGVRGSDPRQRFLCAYIFGITEKSEHAEDVARALLPHLADNKVENDAALAARALYKVGPKAAPFLEKALAGADQQQQRFLLTILRDYTDPPANLDEAKKRGGLHDLTNMAWDPAWEDYYQKNFKIPSGTW